MSKMTCPNCGNSVPEGSVFCNRCGCRINPEDVASDFDNKDLDDDWNFPASKLDQLQNKKKSSQSNHQKNSKGWTYTVYALIVLAVIGFCTLVYCTRCSKNNREAHPVSTIDDSGAACADTLWQVLNEYNYVGDGARIVYAARATGSQPGVNDNIIGITQKTGEFYKIYKLIKKEGKWIIIPEEIKQVSTAGYDVTFDQNKMMAGQDIIPQMVPIGGKKYFFYAFMQTPLSDQSRAQVVLNMYDVETRSVTTATYEGEFQNVGNERVIVCNPVSSNSEEVKWMNGTARNFIRIIRFKDEEQPVEEKKEEEKKEEVEQKPEEPKQEQPENSAVTETKDKDNPMFNVDDVVKTVRSDVYKVILLKDGSVISCNTATGQNSKIHSGGAKDIGFKDIANCILNIRKNDDTRKVVDLKTGQIINDSAPAPQPEKKEEKKEENKEEKKEG